MLWSFEKSMAEQFVSRNQGKEIDGACIVQYVLPLCLWLTCLFSGVIEFVRDAGTMRVELLPSHQFITLMLSGVKVCIVTYD